MLTNPQKDAGLLTEAPVSVPMPTVLNPAATAAAEPLEEPLVGTELFQIPGH